MAGYKEVFVAHYECGQRRRGVAKWATKEFETKWEAEKWLQNYKNNHWWASMSGWVDSKVIDLRSPMQKALDAQVEERVARRIAKSYNF